MLESISKRLSGICFSACMLAALLMIVSASGFAQHAAKGKTPGNDEVAVGAAGQKVAIDPATGKLRQPTREEIEALVAGMKINDSAEGLQAKRVSNGSVVMDLEGRFENVTVARINDDGSISTACVTSADQAKNFLKADAAKEKAKADPTKWEEK